MTPESKTSPKRIGLLVPSSNTVLEPDFYRNLPENFSLHTARMYLEVTTAAGESRMLDEFALPAARDVATARPHTIVFGCTSAGALRGNAYDDQLCQKISEISGVPTVSVIRSVREALQKLSARRLVVVTPYVEELNVRIRASLEEDGLEIMKIEGLGISENFTIAVVPDQQIIDLAMNTVRGLQPDVLFVSCTNFPAMRVLQRLRQALPYPVISSNQVAVEKAIQVASAASS